MPNPVGADTFGTHRKWPEGKVDPKQDREFPRTVITEDVRPLSG